LRKRILLELAENADKAVYQQAMQAMRFSIGLSKDQMYKEIESGEDDQDV